MPDALDQRMKAPAPMAVLTKGGFAGAVSDRALRPREKRTQAGPAVALKAAQRGKGEPPVDQGLAARHLPTIGRRCGGARGVVEDRHPFAVGVAEGHHRRGQSVFAAQQLTHALATKLRASDGPFGHGLVVAVDGPGSEGHDEPPVCRFSAGQRE